MLFVHFPFLFGAGLIAVPIVLHLIMRRRAEAAGVSGVAISPARRDTNQRRLKLRHLLLLLLRAAIALLALALAGPACGPRAASALFWAARRPRWRRPWFSTPPRAWIPP